jgi:hypothetical protein
MVKTILLIQLLFLLTCEEPRLEPPSRRNKKEQPQPIHEGQRIDSVKSNCRI